MEDKIYELMAQAEELQDHAVTLQKDAQKAILQIPRQIDRMEEEICHTARFWAIMTASALLVGMILIAGGLFLWEMEAGEKRAALQAEISTLERKISELEDQEERLKIWGGELVENEAGKFIEFPPNFEIRVAKINGRPTVRVRAGE